MKIIQDYKSQITSDSRICRADANKLALVNFIVKVKGGLL